MNWWSRLFGFFCGFYTSLFGVAILCGAVALLHTERQMLLGVGCLFFGVGAIVTSLLVWLRKER